MRIKQNTRHVHRRGYTMIELVVAMTSASVLMASLAGTVVVATNLLETRDDGGQGRRDREIEDRLSADLRYATDVQAISYGLQIAKPNVSTGTNETASYESYFDGLLRSVDGGAQAVLDAEAPSSTLFVDGYSAPTYVPNPAAVRVRAATTTTLESLGSSMSCELPKGCQSGDLLLLCLAAETPTQVDFSQSGWSQFGLLNNDDVRLLMAARSYNGNNDDVELIFPNESVRAAAVIVALENASLSAISSGGNNTGFAWRSNPSTHPQVISFADMDSTSLNVQIVAADGSPWTNTCGVAGFTDVAVVETNAVSIAVAVRNGQRPSTMATQSRFWQQSSGYYIQSAFLMGNGG